MNCSITRVTWIQTTGKLSFTLFKGLLRVWGFLEKLKHGNNIIKGIDHWKKWWKVHCHFSYLFCKYLATSIDQFFNYCKLVKFHLNHFMPPKDLPQKMYLRASAILIHSLSSAELLMENILSWQFIEFFFYPEKDYLQLKVFKWNGYSHLN